jgi:hypothetical protein
MKIMNQKGMEMAIQIFIVLFVLLAVAMIVLQLVSQQFTNNETQLKSMQSKSEFTQQIKENKLKCESLCKSEKAEDRTAYCMTSFEFSKLGEANQTDFIPGVISCEDKVYCSQLYPCESLTMADCPRQLCGYWVKTMGLSKSQADTLLEKYILPGICYKPLPDSDKPLHWYGMTYDGDDGAFDGNIDNKVLCSAIITN